MKNSVPLSLSKNYVAHWTWKEAVREILQNAIDCREWGIGKDADGKLVISSFGGSIPRTALLLGESGKRDDEKIGKFGEGLKLALLILCREGYDVAVHTGKEVWTPYMDHSEQFGTECLHIFIEESDNEDDSAVHVSIGGLSREQFDEIDDMYLSEEQMEDAIIEVDGCHVFNALTTAPEYDDGMYTDDEIPRKVYCGGLFVCNLPENFEYSYNFRPDRIKLDRDRKTVQAWDIAWEISRIFASAGRADMIVSLAGQKKEDVGNYSTIHTTYYGASTSGKSTAEFSEELQTLAAESFKTRHGERAVPVYDNMDHAKRQLLTKAIHKAGYIPVNVGKSEFDMIGDCIQLPENLTLPDEPNMLSLLLEWKDKFGGETSEAGNESMNEIIEKLQNWVMFKGE
ncbi:hypothetical protein KASHIRA_01120 [Serratia phage vB_SmaM-Kashira]|nr:histidine kinase-like ATPase [Acinetobacter phage ABPH49]URC22686.1 hypothetical protein KASHIRA_01120 [Serratia phage vB_SmaM-Kashira]